jgi:hypothetical protein
MKTCNRCGELHNCELFADVPLCPDCVDLIVREWRIRRNEFAELTEG